MIRYDSIEFKIVIEYNDGSQINTSIYSRKTSSMKGMFESLKIDYKNDFQKNGTFIITNTATNRTKRFSF